MAISLTPSTTPPASSVGTSQITDGSIVAADLNAGVVNGLTTVTAASGDYVAIADVSDSNNVKKALVSDITALVSSTPSVVANGRLTLTTATPVTTSNVTAATTVYFTPYQGDQIQLYNGSAWVQSTFTELSQATTDTTKSPAACANNSNYDMFVWSDSGTLRCTRGPAWTSDTGRGTGAGTTELQLLNGRWTNKVSITNGPVANLGLYVGTIRTDGSAQANDSAAKRHVWNMYNRRPRAMTVADTTDTWAYSTAAYRQANANAANQLDVVVGIAEDLYDVTVVGAVSTGIAGLSAVGVGIGLDSTTVQGANHWAWCYTNNTENQPTFAWYKGNPGIGRHYFAWLENGNGGTTVTWCGDNGGQTATTGIFGTVFA